MLDRITQRRIQVGDYGETALILVNTRQAGAVKEVLQHAGVPYATTTDGTHSSAEAVYGVAVIVLDNCADALRVRALLDAAP